MFGTLPRLNELLIAIDTQMGYIQSLRPLSAGEKRELQKSLRVMEVYNSNAIEGNTLTLGETKLIIEDGITIGGKTLREMHEATNLGLALQEYLSKNHIIDEKTIQHIHSIIMRNIDDENAGKYRNIQVSISGDAESLPPAKEVPKLMRELMDWYMENRGKIHPTLLASEFHYRFVKIHPFIDGNGRTARLLANMIVLSYDYPMIILPVVRRGEYITSLHSATGSLEIFSNFYADIIHENIKDYIRMITP